MILYCGTMANDLAPRPWVVGQRASATCLVP